MPLLPTALALALATTQPPPSEPEPPLVAEPEPEPEPEPEETIEILDEPDPATATPTDPPPPVDSKKENPYAPGVYAEAAATMGLGQRRIGPVARTGDGTVNLPYAAAVVDFWLRISGVPAARPELEIFGGLRLRQTIGMRVHTPTTNNTTPRRPRTRSQHSEASFGLVGWPRGADHRIGLGGEFVYTLMPFLMEAKLDIPSFLLHGPVVAGRFEAQMRSDALRFILRPFAGAAIPDRQLRDARFTGPGPLFGVEVKLAVRIYGMLYGVASFTERHAPLPFGNGGQVDDFERAGSLGLMVRAPRRAKK